jgi:allantoin racemase
LKIKVILPITSKTLDDESKEEFSSYAFPGTEISVTHLDYGPASVECEYDEALCVPDFLSKAQQAEAEGYDAVISDCFGDPGVKPARELLHIPVIGAAEASMHFAATLGQRFSVVTVLASVVPLIENLGTSYGLDKKLASVRSVDIPVLELEDKERTIKALHEEMLAAIREDHAHVLVLGCTGMMGVSKELEKLLKKDGYEVPVVNAAAASLKFIEALTAMGLKQSRLSSMTPPEKARTGLPVAETVTA